MSKRLITSFLSLSLLGFLLTACTPAETYEHAEGAALATKTKIAEKKHNQMKDPPPVVRKAQPYVDVKPISLEADPAWFNQEIELHGNDLPFILFTTKVMENTGAAVNFHSAFDKYQTVSLDYRGTVKGALDLLAAQTGSVYQAKDRRVRWTDMVTRSFNVSFIPGESDYLVGRKGGGGSDDSGGGGSGSSIQQVTAQTSQDAYSNLGGKMSVWKDLDSAIKNMLSSDGKAVVSEATTSVTVTDHIENIRDIEHYLTELNENLSRQVLLKVVVLDVTLNQDYTYGIDWDVIRNQFGKNWRLSGNFGSPVSVGDTASVGALSIFFDPRKDTQSPSGLVPTLPLTGNHDSTSRNAGSGLIVKALESQGRVSIVTRPEVVTLNNQVAEIAIINQTAYLASVTTTLEEGQSQTSLEPGIVTSGFSLYVLPKIQDKKVYLQITTSLSNLEDIQTQSAGGSAPVQIQTPELAEKYFNQRSMLHSGETLILAGFKSLNNTTGANKNFGSDVLGGKGAIRSNTETLILITPYVMGGHHDPHVVAMRPIDGGVD